jgi:hypothetical protein
LPALAATTDSSQETSLDSWLNRIDRERGNGKQTSPASLPVLA